MADVRCQCDFFLARKDVVAHRLRRVMRNPKRLHAKVIHRADLVRIHNPLVARRNPPKAFLHRRPGIRRSKNRDIKPTGKNACPLDMVNMLMGDKQRIYFVARQLQICKPFLDFLTADACINQYFRVIRPDIGAVAAAATGDGAKFHPQASSPLFLRVFP